MEFLIEYGPAQLYWEPAEVFLKLSCVQLLLQLISIACNWKTYYARWDQREVSEEMRFCFRWGWCWFHSVCLTDTWWTALTLWPHTWETRWSMMIPFFIYRWFIYIYGPGADKYCTQAGVSFCALRSYVIDMAAARGRVDILSGTGIHVLWFRLQMSLPLGSHM